MPSAIRLLPVAATRASLAIDGPAAATFNTVVEATDHLLGGNGNLLTLALAAGGTWVPNVGTLTLTGNPTNAKASLDLDATLTTNCDTVIEAAVAGAAGNLTTIAFAAGSAVDEGEYDESAFPDITFTFKSGTTTVADFEAAVTASEHLLVKTAGTGANVLAVTDDDFAAEPLAGGTTETVTIGSTVYTFVTTATSVPYTVEISAVNASGTIDNLIAAVNAAAGAGTVYGTGTAVHPTVRAFAGAGDTMVVHTKSDTILTAVGTLIATTVSADDAGVTSLFPGSWAAATLADGTDGTNVEFEVDGTAVSCVFSSGYTTVSDFEAALAANAAVAAVMRVKTAGTTPLYQLVVTDDDFTATAFSGGGATSSGVPTLGDETVGVAVPHCTDQATILVRSVAGSGTMTANLRLWGYSTATDNWYSLGLLNSGSDIPEVDSNLIAYAEVVVGLRKFSRLYCEIETLGGTGTEVEVYADCTPASPVSH